jgi:tRNA 2-selenouridine synthase
MQEIPEFLNFGLNNPILDVRSPAEYALGHIPGALSFPLFSDDERASVGTTYKQKSKEAAFLLGLEIVGPKMAGFVRAANKLAPNKKIAVHCWRGGQRSGSMAWLLRSAGMEVQVLKGGYKAYRSFILEAFFEKKWQIRVLGGKTGSGKTKILYALRSLGAQVIDLEGLANHKGSAFGFIGEEEQPRTEQFENNLYAALLQLDPSRPVWVENESRSIGKVFIPAGFWDAIKSAPLFNIEVPQSARIQNLLSDYVLEHKEELILAFTKIERKLGGQHLKSALEALEANDFGTAADVALTYYDKTYQYCLDNNVAPHIFQLPFETGEPSFIAQALIEFESQQDYPTPPISNTNE